MKINKKAEIDMKSILIGLIFVVLISSLFSIMITEFTNDYNTDLNGSIAFLESVGQNSSEYSDLSDEYFETLFKDRESSTLDWIDFMWKGGWTLLKRMATLPFNVLNIVAKGLIQVGVPTQLSIPINIFVYSILAFIIVYAILWKLPGFR